MRPQPNLNPRETQAGQTLRSSKGSTKCRPYARKKAGGEGVEGNDSPHRMKLIKKAQSIVSQSCAGLKRPTKGDLGTLSSSRIKAPEVRTRASRLPFKPTSFHVTGFELQTECATQSSLCEWSAAESSVSFSCYNTEVLNYRLFKEPPVSVFRSQRLNK
jgi:hypothetical protein